MLCGITYAASRPLTAAKLDGMPYPAAGGRGGGGGPAKHHSTTLPAWIFPLPHFLSSYPLSSSSRAVLTLEVRAVGGTCTPCWVAPCLLMTGLAPGHTAGNGDAGQGQAWPAIVVDVVAI